MLKNLTIPHGLKSLEELEIFRKYDVLKCAFWIKFRRYRKVCLQFPDELLKDSVSVCSMIEERVDHKLYILADTSFGSCCVDYVAARHVDADGVIHFGHSCLTSNNEIPTLYVFPKEPLNVKETCDAIISFTEEVTDPIIVLYDVSYSHYVEELISELAKVRGLVRLSMLATPQQRTDHVKMTPCDVIKTIFCRYYSLSFIETDDPVIYLWVSPPHKRHLIENIVLADESVKCYRYCPEKTTALEKLTLPLALKRRLFEVQKIKEAKRIGILVSTLSTDRYLDAVERIKTLCRLSRKNSYIFSVGKINVEKLANFPEIDVFVLIGCPETEIENKRDFYQPIVGIMEVEIALNENDVRWQNVIKDYREFLPGGSQYKEINEDEVKNRAAEADVSLISNTVVTNPAVSTSKAEVGDQAQAVVTRDPLTIAERSANYDLTEKSYKGLQPNIGKTPVEKASVGRKGTPSGGYEHPTSDKLS